MSMESRQALEAVNAELGIETPDEIRKDTAREARKDERDAGIAEAMDILKESIDSGAPEKEGVIELQDSDLEDITDTSEAAVAEAAAQTKAGIEEARKAIEGLN